MRIKEEIIKEALQSGLDPKDRLVLEVLVDIRDVLGMSTFLDHKGDDKNDKD